MFAIIELTHFMFGDPLLAVSGNCEESCATLVMVLGDGGPW